MPIGANAKKEEKQLLKKKTESTMWRKARQAIVCVPQLDAVHCSGKSIICLGQTNRICGDSNARIRCPPIQGYRCLSNEQNEFITWLRNRGEHDASSAITIGMSIHGRALYASRPIKAGERVLRVSQNLMITPDRLSIAIIRLLEGAISQWGRLALFLLAEKHAGETSAWAPYIAALPERDSIHSTIFWKKEEMDAIKESIVHRETMQRKAVIRAEFSALQHVLLQFPDIFGEQVSYLDFKHAYTIVCSRAWGIEALSTLALVPYVDFFNHNANCTTMSYDEENACAEVIADKDYSEGEQVVISYGPLPNSTLALDFGFTLAYNPHDQVEIWMGLSRRDPLFVNKLDLLHSHNMPTMLNADGSDSGGSSFVLQEVKSPIGRGKGIPHSLRAFARVACASSVKELSDMASDAARHDGRLGRRPLENTKKEAQAMALILGRIEILTQQHVAAVLALKARQNMSSVHRDMAEAILGGELRVLRSVSAWFKEQCKLQFVAK